MEEQRSSYEQKIAELEHQLQAKNIRQNNIRGSYCIKVGASPSKTNYTYGLLSHNARASFSKDRATLRSTINELKRSNRCSSGLGNAFCC